MSKRKQWPKCAPYMIRQVTEHCWQLLTLTTIPDTGEPLYAYAAPVHQSCRSKAEALAWLKSSVTGERPDRDAFEPLVHGEPEYFDLLGNPCLETGLKEYERTDV